MEEALLVARCHNQGVGRLGCHLLVSSDSESLILGVAMRQILIVNRGAICRANECHVVDVVVCGAAFQRRRNRSLLNQLRWVRSSFLVVRLWPLLVGLLDLSVRLVRGGRCTVEGM